MPCACPYQTFTKIIKPSHGLFLSHCHCVAFRGQAYAWKVFSSVYHEKGKQCRRDASRDTSARIRVPTRLVIGTCVNIGMCVYVGASWIHAFLAYIMATHSTFGIRIRTEHLRLYRTAVRIRTHTVRLRKITVRIQTLTVRRCRIRSMPDV